MVLFGQNMFHFSDLVLDVKKVPVKMRNLLKIADSLPRSFRRTYPAENRGVLKKLLHIPVRRTFSSIFFRNSFLSKIVGAVAGPQRAGTSPAPTFYK